MQPTQGSPMQMPVSLALSGIGFESDDHDLVEQAKRDREAFAVLYRRHYAMVAGYIHRRVGDRHVTEDLAAEVFLAALRCLGRYRHRGLPLRAWLYRIATNTVNRWARRTRHEIKARFDELVIRRWIEPSSAVTSHDEHDTEFARMALLSLRPKYQSVLTLHYLEGMALEEIAAALGCRIGTVKSRLSRGRDALREKLAARCGRHRGGRGV
jgi:RNA polymerase sigma-70 factor (ECF subfamily)